MDIYHLEKCQVPSLSLYSNIIFIYSSSVTQIPSLSLSLISIFPEGSSQYSYFQIVTHIEWLLDVAVNLFLMVLALGGNASGIKSDDSGN